MDAPAFPPDGSSVTTSSAFWLSSSTLCLSAFGFALDFSLTSSVTLVPFAPVRV